MDLAQYRPLDKQINARSGIGVVAKLNDAGEPIQQYEILMAKKDSIIVRALGARKASTPVKIELPLVWDSNGHVVDGAKFQLMVKPDVELDTKAKTKKKGPKREGPTKLSLCRQIFKDNPNLAAADMKAKFVSDALCTTAGANTYYLLIKKEVQDAK